MHPEGPSAITGDTRETKIQTCIGELDKWSRCTQEELDRHKIVLDTFHALLPVVSTSSSLVASIINYSGILRTVGFHSRHSSPYRFPLYCPPQVQSQSHRQCVRVCRTISRRDRHRFWRRSFSSHPT